MVDEMYANLNGHNKPKYFRNASNGNKMSRDEHFHDGFKDIKLIMKASILDYGNLFLLLICSSRLFSMARKCCAFFGFYLFKMPQKFLIFGFYLNSNNLNRQNFIDEKKSRLLGKKLSLRDDNLLACFQTDQICLGLLQV